MEPGLVVFDTVLGHCGLAWEHSALLGVQLPEGDAGRTGARLRTRFPTAREQVPPPWVRQAVDDLTELLRGNPREPAEVPLRMDEVSEFAREVYAQTRAIPPGRTSTYGAIAATLGEPSAARAVGHALGNNPFPIVVPCHRVLAADGGTGGFSAAGGVRTKLRMLEIEGACEPTLFELG